MPRPHGIVHRRAAPSFYGLPRLAAAFALKLLAGAARIRPLALAPDRIGESSGRSARRHRRPPNVGKSSLFNWLAGRRISIVDPTAGVTRDRVSTLVEAEGRYFELIDTGGIGIEDADNLTAEIERQITIGIDQADVILFVVDIRAGLMPLDEEVGRRLRYVTKPVLLIANKCDDAGDGPAGERLLQARPRQGPGGFGRAEARPGPAPPRHPRQPAAAGRRPNGRRT